MDKGNFGRKDRLIKEHRHDTYRMAGKWPEPTQCSRCGAVFTNGRWSWDDPAVRTNETVCPACRRIADNYPAGIIELRGEFFHQRREEILNLSRNIEEQEKGEHPMERIIAIKNEGDHTVITTTGIHIARRIGEAVSRSYKGKLSCRYNRSDKSIRVAWQR